MKKIALAGLIITTSLMNPTRAEAGYSKQTKEFLFGIGLGSLAEKQCPGYRRGPTWYDTTANLRVVLILGGYAATYSDAKLIYMGEQVAKQELRRKGLKICVAAAKAAAHWSRIVVKR